MNLILMGAPGAGKGTHAREIVKKYTVPHVSTGDILRAEAAKNSELGDKAKGFMEAGKLLPDDIIIDIIKERLKEDDCTGGYLFDGFPRTKAQAELLSTISNVELVIYLVCSDDILIKRLTGRRNCPQCGRDYNVFFSPPQNDKNKCDQCNVDIVQRADDNEKTIKERLQVFYNTFSPIMDYYKAQNLFVEIRGDEDRDVTLANIFRVIEKRIT
ncbi:adenylate kinase [Spirochaetota bacterium]